MIYTASDGRQIRLSEDRTIATIEKTVPVTQSADQLVKNYDRITTTEFTEILTTPDMVRRALRGFAGDEVILLGVSTDFADVGARVMKVRDEKDEKVTILAGRVRLQ
jgi:hypothetical protein